MIVYILIIAHLLADFTFQSTSLAKNKAEQFKYLAVHAFIYAIVFAAPILLFVGLARGSFLYVCIIVSHFLIDWIRQIIEKKGLSKGFVFALFIFDQMIHILIIILLVSLLKIETHTNAIYAYAQTWVHFRTFIIYALTLTVIWEPTAVLIKRLFIYILDENTNDNDEGDPKIGRMIGKLERLLISALVLCNQLGAIGFVLTAKSIARYKQLEDKAFAEKYLVGTLASTAISFMVAMFLKSIV